MSSRVERPGIPASAALPGDPGSFLLEMASLAGVAAAFLDRAGQLVGWTPGAERFLELGEGSIGLHVGRIPAHLVDARSFAGDVEGALLGRFPPDRDLNLSDGSWARLRIGGRGDGDGLVLSFADITGSKLEELRLRDREHRLRAMLENGQEPLHLKDLEGRILEANSAALRAVGKSVDEVVGRTDREVFGDNAVAAALRENDRRALEEERAVVVEEVLPGTGGTHLVRSVKSPWYDAAGALAGTVGAFRDVTESRRMALELKAKDERFRELVESLPLAVYASGGLGTSIEYINPSFERMFGYSKEELPSLERWWNLAYPDPAYRDLLFARWGERLLRSGRGGPPAGVEETTVTCKDGSTRNVRWMVQELGGKWVVTGLDVTGLRGREEELRRTASQLGLVLDNTDEAIAHYDTGRRLVWANRAFLSSIAGTADAPGRLEKLVGRTCIDIWGIADFCPDCPVERCVRTGLNCEARIDPRNLDEGRHARECWQLRSAPVRGDSGEVVGAIAVAVSVAEQVRMEDRLLRSEKLAAVGELAGGVAHNFNNQLTGIGGFAELLLLRETDPELRRYAEGIKDATLRAKQLTGQLLSFARKGTRQRIPLDIDKAVSDTVDLLRHTLDRSILVECDLRARPTLVTGDPSQLHDALLNLGLNARDAMSGGGILRFSTRCVRLDAEEARGLGVEPGEFVRLEVSDTGTGMEPRTLDRLFEPFFTTKPVGQGTGLGLASVHGAVAGMGGAIHVDSAEGAGSTFTLLVPAAGGGMAHPVPSAPDPDPAGFRRGRVFLVDDEAVVLRATAGILSFLGFEVVSCSDSVEAVEVFRREWREIDLVILDLVMPGMGGRDVLRALRAIDPDVRVVVSSGYSLKEARPSIAEGAGAFLQKPYDLATLKRVLSEVLGGVVPGHSRGA